MAEDIELSELTPQIIFPNTGVIFGSESTSNTLPSLYTRSAISATLLEDSAMVDYIDGAVANSQIAANSSYNTSNNSANSANSSAASAAAANATNTSVVASKTSASNAANIAVAASNSASNAANTAVSAANSVAAASATISNLDTRVIDLEERYPDPITSRNLMDPLSSQSELGKYITPSNGNIGVLANYGVIGPFPVVAGQDYRIDLTKALVRWGIYNHPSAIVHFYNSTTMSNANWIGALDAADPTLNISADSRVCTFTAPTSATYAGFVVKDVVGSFTPLTSDFQELLHVISITDGLVEKPLEAVFPASEPKVDGVVEISGDYLYVRVPYRIGSDAVYKVNANYTAGSNNGVIDFDGVRIISSATAHSNTKTAFDASSITINGGGDSSPPFKLNNMFIGGGHGIVSEQITYASHGKSNVDRGSSYTDEAAKVWIVMKIVDSNTLIFTANNTGNATSWVVNGTVTGNLTHTAGGTNTADVIQSARVSTQLWPCLQNYLVTPYVDGKKIAWDDGVYRFDEFRLVESYGIPNVASLIDKQVADVGDTAEPDFTNPDVQTQVEIQTTYTWDFSGPCETIYTALDIQNYSIGYFGGMQQQVMSAGTYDTRYLYVPRCNTDSSSLQTGKSLTGLASQINVYDENFTVPDEPPDRFWQLIKRAPASAQRNAWIMGYSKNAGSPRANVDLAFYMPNSSLKMYPVAADAGVSTAGVAGELHEVYGFFGPMDVSRDANFTAKLLFRDIGKHSLYLHATASVDNVWVELDQRLVGKPVTTTYTSGLSCKSSIVTSKGVLIDGTSGEVEVLIG